MLGKTISHYKILEKIGEGGMGEVYRATDTKLNRDVALKILPEQFASDSQRMGRFQREAEVLASLDHPNIGQIYGIEEAGQTKALVLQLIEGPTLADKISEGPIPVEDALKIALQIAEGLEAAHEKGVIHRDLKPANIKITPEGQVKILDFGLAKLQAADTPTDLSALPTEQANLTAEGTILGTFHYMAPEQLEGKDVDARADIYALCLVLYEMITAKQVFNATTQASLIAAILKDKPRPLTELQPITPPQLDRVVQTGLEKDPEKRWQSAREVKHALEWIGLEAPGAAAPVVEAKPSPAWKVATLVAAGVAVIATVIGLWPGSSPVVPVTRFGIPLETGRFVQNVLGVIDIAIAPQGDLVVYVSSDGNATRLNLRMLDEYESSPIPGTEGATTPFFSPDGEWLGFFANGQLLKLSMRGGSPQAISEAPLNPVGASWGPNDTIVFGEVSRGLSIVSTEGNTSPEVLTVPAAEEVAHYWPTFLPDGQHLLFSLGNIPREIAVFSFETETWKSLDQPASGPARYVSTGNIVYSDANDLWAVSFDLTKLESRGPAIPIETELYASDFGGELMAPFAISSSNSLIHLMPIAQTSPVWADRETGLVDDGRSFSLPLAYYPRLSPGGDKLAVTREGRTWIYGLGSGSPGRPLTDSVSKTYVPVWTPDGGRVAFGDYRSGNPNLTWQAADGSDEAVTLLESTNRHYPADWFNKETLVFFEVSPKTRGNIMTLHLSETEPEVQSFLSTPNEERTPRLSPDGRWLAYASNESGAYNVYVRRFPEADMLQAVSTEGGGEPVWSADGTELFYRRGNYMMVVSVESGETLSLGTPEPLFEGPYATTPCCGASYVVAPDSESFLMFPLNNSAGIRVTRNWIEELKEKVNGQ